jgi:formimidoylglutamate deiminase
MKRYQLEAVLLARGWVHEALVSVAADGMITEITVPSDETPPAAGVSGALRPAERDLAPPERITGFVIPGMANAHSHAFQRAMVGNTEYRRGAHDSFWTWREAMYSLANRIEPEELEIIATQLFIEMLKAGYTAVAEFHYLHRRRDGSSYAAPNALWQAMDAAAERAGIALTLLPTLYQTSDFGGEPLRAEQARFHMDSEHFIGAIEARLSSEGEAPGSLRRTGAAFHSLRAVPLEVLADVSRALRAKHPDLPIHIHIAEQRKEVEACLAMHGRRPIERLLDSALLDRSWCLVHATHATPAELRGIAAASATVCLSITTEANLGDGFFDAARFFAAGGRVCIGSDSQASVSPCEELRWLEYQTRLRKRRRGVLAQRSEPHVGTRLWRHAADEGAAAVGQPAGRIEVGRRADWLVLDPRHASMAGAHATTALDHLLFAGDGARAIRDVMVGGHWRVRDRRHVHEEAVQPRFHALMARLAAPA